MKQLITISLFLITGFLHSQIDSTLIKSIKPDTTASLLNMDAV